MLSFFTSLHNLKIPFPITLSSSFLKVLLCVNPILTRRTSGHCMGNFRAANISCSYPHNNSSKRSACCFTALYCCCCYLSSSASSLSEVGKLETESCFHCLQWSVHVSPLSLLLCPDSQPLIFPVSVDTNSRGALSGTPYTDVSLRDCPLPAVRRNILLLSSVAKRENSGSQLVRKEAAIRLITRFRIQQE